MVFCSLWQPKTKENKNKKQEQKKETKERSKKKKRKVWVWGGVVCLCAWPFFGGGGWCALYITCFFFLTAFPTRCQCRGALLASHAAWRKYLTTFNLVGGAAPQQNEDGQQLRPTAWLAPAAMLLYIGTRWGTVSSLALHPPLSSLVSFSCTLALCSLVSSTCSSLLTQ